MIHKYNAAGMSHLLDDFFFIPGMSIQFGCTCTFMFKTNVVLPSHLKISINDNHTIEEFVFPFELLLYQNLQQTSFVLP